MSIDPAGTILDDDRLLEFRKTETTTVGELALEVSPVADAMGAESDEHVTGGSTSTRTSRCSSSPPSAIPTSGRSRRRARPTEANRGENGA
ncbi:hypothetical protein [Natronorubrum tibetense]|uniref:hypothetical protein n=1 Tax=Natronorubrum tibetense TaxID=63128 RepID=UPI000AA4C461|nr:hypothetical protein [Natronorubrum tibetense]